MSKEVTAVVGGVMAVGLLWWTYDHFNHTHNNPKWYESTNMNSKLTDKHRPLLFMIGYWKLHSTSPIITDLIDLCLTYYDFDNFHNVEKWSQNGNLVFWNDRIYLDQEEHIFGGIRMLSTF